MIKGLPETPGVYIFYDEQKLPLYIGKSIDIRERVMSHFNDVTESARELEMCNRIHHIEYHPTIGEFGALLLEASLVKELKPYYNRALRHCSEVVLAKRKQTEAGYYSVVLEEKEALGNEDYGDIVGIFKSAAKAKGFLKSIVDGFCLCSKIMGLEKTKGACFNYQLGRCKGACVGEENVNAYNLRFTTACSKTHIEEWPFKEAIIIQEKTQLPRKRWGMFSITGFIKVLLTGLRMKLSILYLTETSLITISINY